MASVRAAWERRPLRDRQAAIPKSGVTNWEVISHGISNRERVGRGLELLRKGLKPFVEREMRAVHGDQWVEAVRLAVWGHRRSATGRGGGFNWDTKALLDALWNQWNAVFSNRLGRAERNLVAELRDVRNDWAHEKPFSSNDAHRVLDSIYRLLTAISAEEAAEADRQRQEILRMCFEDQERRGNPLTAPRRLTSLSAESARAHDSASHRREFEVERVLCPDACRKTHLLLGRLPIFSAPGDPAFTDGLYFFYEEGECSEHGREGRVVRIGNHPRSDRGLVRRLREHYSGSKNGSVFRKFLGGALMRARDPGDPCLAPAPGEGHWEHQDAPTCSRCKPVEKEVSELLRSKFRFRCVRVENRAVRNHLEGLLVATIAACQVCRPSADWLGRYAYSEVVRSSGLWNSQHVGGPTLGGEDLERFEELVEQTARLG